MSHTYAILAVPPSVFDKVRSLLVNAGYDHAIDGDVIDMHGIALQADETPIAEADAFARMTPPHPGEFLRSEIIDPRGLTIVEVSEALRVNVTSVQAFLSGRLPLSENMAIRIEKAYGLKLETLMRMQSTLDIARAREAFPTYEAHWR